MNVAIYQPEERPMAVVSFAPGADVAQESRRAVPSGLPFWLVPKAEIDALYESHGAYRDAWQLDPAALGRPADGVGEA